MKIKNIISILGVLSFGLSLQSCDDFLTETNPNYLSTDTYFTTLDECSNGLNAVYNSFMEPENYCSATAENKRADMLVQANPARETITDEAYMQSFTDSYSTSGDKWANLYKGIFRANQVIEAVDALVEISDFTTTQLETADVIKAQAYFMRGLFYFWLNTTFNDGSVPYLDTASTSEVDFYNSCLASDRIIGYYRQDLLKAIELGLPESWSGEDVGRVTSWAAKAILGKSYLYEEDYATAGAYFKEIIDSGQFQLMEDIADNFTDLNEFNEESLLEVSYSMTYNTEFGLWSTACQYNWFGMQFSPKGGWGTVAVPYWLVEEFEEYELVDTQNPMNWVEMSYDTRSYAGGEYYDVIYEPAGQECGDEYSTTDATYGDVTYRYKYVYVNLGTGDAYDANVYRRLEILDPDTGELLTDPTYTSLFTNSSYNPFYGKLDIQWQGGVPMRLKMYTPRASASITINGDEELPYYGMTPCQAGGFKNGATGHYRKHTNYATYTTESEGDQYWGSAINFRLIRYADILLMYAECLIEGGTNNSGFNEAMMYVNRIRERGGAVLIGSEKNGMAEFYGSRSYQDSVIDTSTGDVADTMNPFISDASGLMTHLMYKERPLELCCEGNAIRTIDLLRWGITKERFVSLAQDTYITKQRNYLAFGSTDTETTDQDETKLLTISSNWCKQARAYTDPTATSSSDYSDAAVNYNEKVAYWPIPNTEVSSNPYISY